MGGDFDGGEYVKKKLYIITVAAIGGLLGICILMAGVIIAGNSRERKYLREVIRRREEGESRDVNNGDDIEDWRQRKICYSESYAIDIGRSNLRAADKQSITVKANKLARL